MTWIFFGILPVVIHELAHFLTAILTVTPIRFSFTVDNFVPRLLMYFNTQSKKKLKLIGQAGFAAELVLIPFMPASYQVVALLHFIAYPWYAKEVSDFKLMS